MPKPSLAEERECPLVPPLQDPRYHRFGIMLVRNCPQFLKLWLRILLGRWMQARLHRRARPWPVSRQAPRVSLVIAPHPDDCTLGCGGVIAHRIGQGEIVHVAYITDGSASHQSHPEFTPAMIAELRADEARQAMTTLGVPAAHLTFLGAPDGQLPHLDAPTRTPLVARLRILVENLGPAEVFITSRHDGSSEHTAACDLVLAALEGMGGSRPRLLEYLVWSRWSPLGVIPALAEASPIYHHALSLGEAELKKRALATFRTQFEPLSPWKAAVLPEQFVRLFNDPNEFFFEF